MNGGRFDFDDGGTYCGGWEEGKAHGHGVCTGPQSQGEYAGAWHYGFEVSGVYTWPSGSQYAGQWQNGKRHGLGVEQRGRWLYKGEWTQGYKGRYGRREATNSGAHYLGTWSSGLHDGYGTEVYADGGSYKGQWLRGMRHGYGIRTSASWGVAAKQRASAHSHVHASLSSLRSTYGSAILDGGNSNTTCFYFCSFADETAAAMDTPNHTGRSHSRERRGDEQENCARGGFVLRAFAGPAKRRRSLSERSLAMKRTILNNLRIRKQHSTGDIHQRVVSAGGAASLRSSGSTLSCTSDEDSEQPHRPHTDAQQQQEEPPVDANTVEVYRGEWKNDMRSGYGICDRSDGLRYAGEWLDNKKHGYGVTYLKDGTKEEGRYKHNVLVSSTRRRGILFVRSSKLRERVEIYAEHARRAADMATQRVEIAQSRTMTAQERAEASAEAADRARDDADTARIYAAQFDPSFKQPGVEMLRRQRTGTPAGSGGYFPQAQMLMGNHLYANHVQFDHPAHAAAASSAAPVPFDQYQFPSTQQQRPSGGGQWHHSRQHAIALQGSSGSTGGGAAGGPEWSGSGPHSPPQHSADSGTGTAASSLQQQQHQQRSNLLLTQQPSTDSAQSQTMAESTGVVAAGSASLQHEMGFADNAMPSTSAAGLMPNSISAGTQSEFLRRPQQGRANIRPRGSPSTMSLTDDHWDQYLLKASRREGAAQNTADQANLMLEARLRRNRPSLIRQCEVLGASVAVAGNTADSPSVGTSLNLNRRCTLATASRAVPVPIHSVYGADDSIRHEQTTQAEERGSLPNLDELAQQPLNMPREEAARLASLRRLETQRQLEEEELLRQNPLRYLLHPQLRNWLIRWRVPLLLAIGNIVLFYCFVNLLSSGNGGKDRDDRKGDIG